MTTRKLVDALSAAGLHSEYVSGYDGTVFITPPGSERVALDAVCVCTVLTGPGCVCDPADGAGGCSQCTSCSDVACPCVSDPQSSLAGVWVLFSTTDSATHKQ